MTPNLFWLDLKKIDFSPKAGIKKLPLTNGKIYAGDAVKDLKDSDSFVFLFQTPVMKNSKISMTFMPHENRLRAS